MLFSFSDILAATSNGNFNGSFGNKVKPPLAIAAGNKSKEPGKTKKIWWHSSWIFSIWEKNRMWLAIVRGSIESLLNATVDCERLKKSDREREREMETD